MTTLSDLFDELGGIASVRDLAEFFHVSEREVRDWAHENEVPRAGNAFAFRVEDAEAFAAEPEDEADPGSDDDEEDEEDEEESGEDE